MSVRTRLTLVLDLILVMVMVLVLPCVLKLVPTSILALISVLELTQF